MDACIAHFPEYADRIRDPGFQCVVCVNEQSARIRIKSCIFFEGSVLVFKAHDPAVRMGSQNRHVEHFTGQYIGCTYTASYDGSPRSIQPGIRTLGTAQSEFHDTVTLCSMYYAGSLRGDQTLMIDDRQYSGLYKLRLHDRSDNFDQRFSRKDHTSLGNGIDVPAEMKTT